MKSKKATFYVFVIVVIVLAAVIMIRLLTPEDTWLCKNGKWVRHGNPTGQPVGECR